MFNNNQQIASLDEQIMKNLDTGPKTFEEIIDGLNFSYVDIQVENSVSETLYEMLTKNKLKC